MWLANAFSLTKHRYKPKNKTCVVQSTIETGYVAQNREQNWFDENNGGNTKISNLSAKILIRIQLIRI